MYFIWHSYESHICWRGGRWPSPFQTAKTIYKSNDIHTDIIQIVNTHIMFTIHSLIFRFFATKHTASVTIMKGHDPKAPTRCLHTSHDCRLYTDKHRETHAASFHATIGDPEGYPISTSPHRPRPPSPNTRHSNKWRAANLHEASIYGSSFAFAHA